MARPLSSPDEGRALLTKMIGLSVVGHLLVGAAQPGFFSGRKRPLPPRALKLVQERPADQDDPKLAAERLEKLVQSRLSDVNRLSEGTSPSPLAGGRSAAQLSLSASVGVPKLHDAELPNAQGPWGAGASATPVGGGSWASAIDLTNITSAAQGNPVLLSYFGAIRWQIQRAANEGRWISETLQDDGVVYVGFAISRTGAIHSASVISERSTASTGLQESALKIVRSAGPFPPLPPSVAAASEAMAVVVPIEFVMTPPSG